MCLHFGRLYQTSTARSQSKYLQIEYARPATTTTQHDNTDQHAEEYLAAIEFLRENTVLKLGVELVAAVLSRRSQG
jgi:hypothetical protein